MPKISQQKKDKISEQILHYLFSITPEMKFTAQIADEIARDEEFTKKILNDLMQKNLVIPITKNKDGTQYVQRQRWRLSNDAFEAYKRQQPSPSSINAFEDNNI
ncbi:hypothetical protein KW805_02865 [Candidatus Pacearchaeota archaeon]|nr:hypothetical protein [Candidatus Pacearchaeota archaeon]